MSVATMDGNTEKSKNVKDIENILRFQPLRFVHILLSIILTLYGVAILLVIFTVKVHLSDYSPFLRYYMDYPVIILTLGCVVLVGLGCTGIITTSLNIYQGIVTFGVLLFGLLMFELTMAAVFLLVLDSADLSVADALATHFNNYTENAEAMDFIQNNLNCCGVNDFSDWNSTLGYVPGSCCDSDDACGVTDIFTLNEVGCYEALKSLISYLINYLMIILGVLALLQIATMTVTFFLIKLMSSNRRKISPTTDDKHGDVTRNTVNGEFNEVRKIQNPLGIGDGEDADGKTGRGDGGNNSNDSINNRKDLYHQNFDMARPNARDHGHGNFHRSRDISSRHNVNDSNANVYSSHSGNSINNSRERSKAPVVTRLPRAHRKYFPIGF